MWKVFEVRQNCPRFKGFVNIDPPTFAPGEMKESDYYAAFERELNAVDTKLGADFKIFSSTHSPREVFLWLEDRRVQGLLSDAMASLITDYYWEAL
jgi:hypothetical protein